jgi:Predicted signal transduction protein with a C-terminal ATPase domain
VIAFILARNGPISIRTLLLVVFLFLMLLPVIAFTYIIYIKEIEVYRGQVSRYLLQTVEQTQRLLEADLMEIDRLISPLLYEHPLDFLEESIYTSYQRQEANQKFTELVYADLLRGQLDLVRAVHLITPNKTVLSSDNTFQEFGQADIGNYVHIVEQIEKQPLKMRWFSDKWAIYKSREGFETPLRDSVTAARKLVDSNTLEVRGYLFIQLNDRFIKDNLEPVRIGSTGALIVTDENGDEIYRQQSSLFDATEISAYLKAHSSDGGAESSGVQRVAGKWLVAHDTSAVSGLTLTAVVPLDELMSSNLSILRYLLLIAGLAVVIFTVVSILMATEISDPVIKLAKHMSFPSLDNLQFREIHSSIREITMLQRSFNRLMQRIQELLQENERKEREKREALFQALQMQIKPHFLYNTLDTIYWMSKKYNADSISKLVTALGKFFRFTLNAGQEWTTLQKEIEHIENYLQIQAFRYRDKLQYEIALDPETRNTSIMPLILQPVVENALEHGISKAEGEGRVTIRSRKEGDRVYITVHNTGNRLNADELRLQLQSPPSEHYGLANVRQRISMVFGPDYGITLEACEEGGAVATLCIPFSNWNETGG